MGYLLFNLPESIVVCLMFYMFYIRYCVLCCQIKDLPNGKFKLRLHLATIPKELQLNGKSVGETLQKVSSFHVFEEHLIFNNERFCIKN